MLGVGFSLLSSAIDEATSIDDVYFGEDEANIWGFTIAAKTLTNMPSAISSSNRNWVFVIQSSSYDISQFVWNRGSNTLYFRCRQGSVAIPPITWSAWKEL